MIYEKPFTIYTLLSDRYARITPQATAQLLQEVAEMHCTETGIGYHDIIKENKIWVLTRVSYRFVGRFPRLDEQVRLRTWSKGCNGLIATREFEILSSMNEVLVAATSQWVVMDIQTRRVCRLGQDYLADYEHHDRSALTFEAPRLRLPEGMETIAEIPVEFSNIDKAQHVNNSEYIRWAMNYLPTEHQESGLRAIDINYNMETRPGETITIQSKSEGKETYFSFSNERGLSVNCRMEAR